MSQMPVADAVRIEEMVNYFTYDYENPKGDVPFTVYTEMSDCPWNDEARLVHIGLQGKKVEFEVVVHTVEETSLPPVDDALAAMFNVEEGGIKRFKQDVRENMEREAEQKTKTDIRDQVMDGLIKANPIDIPQTMKHQEMHAMQHDAMRRLGIEDHDQAPPLANFEESADKRVRLGLLIRQLIVDQGISVSQEQVRAHLEEMCSGYENPDAMVDMYMNNPKLLEQVEPTVLEQLAIDWLAENGKSKSTQASFTDYMDS